jgi:acetyltransferase-like isoleucine patch superfamily enzyme
LSDEQALPEIRYTPRARRTHGSGEFLPEQLRRLGAGVVFEPGVLLFHPENVEIGDNVYVGHRAILKGYHDSLLSIGDDTWIGQDAFIHAGGGVGIGRGVGIGPCVRILSHQHLEEALETPILHSRQSYSRVVIEDGADVGIGSIILPGVRVGRGAIVGAGSVVTREIPAFTVFAGNPARLLRHRKGWPPA